MKPEEVRVLRWDTQAEAQLAADLVKILSPRLLPGELVALVRYILDDFGAVRSKLDIDEQSEMTLRQEIADLEERNNRLAGQKREWIELRRANHTMAEALGRIRQLNEMVGDKLQTIYDTQEYYEQREIDHAKLLTKLIHAETQLKETKMSQRVTEGSEQSVSVSGTVTAPADAATIVTAGVLPKGLYKVRAALSFAAGAPAAPEDQPARLAKGATTVAVLVAARALNVQFFHDLHVELDGTQALALLGNGAATAAVVYAAQLTATKVG